MPRVDGSGRSIDDLQDFVATRNRLNGITGFLAVQDGRFVQVLEGTELLVGSLFERIEADPRHQSVVKLLDRPIDRRAFAEWTIGLSQPDGQIDGKRHDGEAYVGRADAYWAGQQRVTPPLQGLMDTSVGRMLSELLRLKPVQTRAIETIDRLIAAGETVGLRDGFDQVTIETVASEADMTHQAVYRYFKSSGDVFRAMMKKRQALGIKRMMEALRIENFSDESDLVDFIVSYTVRSFMQAGLVPKKTKIYLVKNYHDIAFQELWKLAEAARQAMERCDILRPGVGVVEIAAGLAAMAGAMKLLLIRDDVDIDQPRAHAILARLFLSTLGSPEAHEGDRSAPVMART